MIKTKSSYDTRSADDGLRILVSSYFPKQTPPGFFDLWFPELGSSLELVKNWNGETYNWETFARIYSDNLQKLQLQSLLKSLATISKQKTITLIGHSRDEKICHRSILKKFLETW